MEDAGARFELFHVIAERGSATARCYVVDHALEPCVQFRNLTYPEVQAAFRARGGHTSPALWDGSRLFQGAESVVSRLQAHVNLGRSE